MELGNGKQGRLGQGGVPGGGGARELVRKGGRQEQRRRSHTREGSETTGGLKPWPLILGAPLFDSED